MRKSINRRSFIIGIMLLAIAPLKFFKSKYRSFKIVKGWLLKIEDIK